MDVLKPELLTIDGLCYRINPGNYNTYLEKSVDQQYYDYDESPLEICSDGEEDIVEIEGGRFKANFHIAKVYFPYIIGAKGATRKRLENETKSKITIPKPGHEGDIVVTGASKKSVTSARRRIRLMVLSSRKRQNVTHFVSIPFSGPSFRSGFATFKNEILEEFRMEETLFVKPERLHMTIGVMFLSDEVERREAAAILEECKQEIVRPILKDKKLRLVMSGVDYMNDDPSAVRVLYGKVQCPDGDQIVRDIADGIVDRFCKRGLMEKEYEHVKIHVTLMNAILKDQNCEVRRKTPPETFDASRIVEKYQNFYFGEEIISTIELSTRYSYSEETGYYQATTLINIP